MLVAGKYHEKPSMGLVYLPIFVVDFDGKLVGKYTSPMDPMGVG